MKEFWYWFDINIWTWLRPLLVGVAVLAGAAVVVHLFSMPQSDYGYCGFLWGCV